MSKVRNLFWLLLVIFCITALNSGCTKTRSKAEYFRDTQGPTMTPHGKIKMDTVEETPNGKIQYQTEDGKTWRVEMNKKADDTYRYGTPDEVK